jgi:hypothetical protein
MDVPENLVIDGKSDGLEVERTVRKAWFTPARGTVAGAARVTSRCVCVCVCVCVRNDAVRLFPAIFETSWIRVLEKLMVA